MKRCSTSLIIRELQIKTMMSYHLIPIWITIIKKTQNNVYTHEHSSSICKSQGVKVTQCLSIDDWINKMDYIHAMEYYSAIRGNKF